MASGLAAPRPPQATATPMGPWEPPRAAGSQTPPSGLMGRVMVLERFLPLDPQGLQVKCDRNLNPGLSVLVSLLLRPEGKVYLPEIVSFLGTKRPDLFCCCHD